MFDAKGNIYGTTVGTESPHYDNGTVFELERVPSGYTEKILYYFAGGSDGANPGAGGLVSDKNGNLYGTTIYGGGNGCSGEGCGTVFELTRSNGVVTETVLYRFTGGTDGEVPWAGLTSDRAGGFYGTTSGAAVEPGNGTVFKLTPSNGSWTESTQYAFTGGDDGRQPFSGLIIDGSGNLYGTTTYGGNQYCPYGGCGVVYELTP